MALRKGKGKKAETINTVSDQHRQAQLARDAAAAANRQYMTEILRPIQLKHFHVRFMPIAVVAAVLVAFAAGRSSQSASPPEMVAMLKEHQWAVGSLWAGFILLSFGMFLVVHGKALFSGPSNVHGQGLFDATEAGHGYKDVPLEHAFRRGIQFCTLFVIGDFLVLLGWFSYRHVESGVFAVYAASIIGVLFNLVFLWKDVAEHIMKVEFKLRWLLLHVVTLGIFKGSIGKVIRILRATSPHRPAKPPKPNAATNFDKDGHEYIDVDGADDLLEE